MKSFRESITAKRMGQEFKGSNNKKKKKKG
jgi:hypothetical protein